MPLRLPRINNVGFDLQNQCADKIGGRDPGAPVSVADDEFLCSAESVRSCGGLNRGGVGQLPEYPGSRMICDQEVDLHHFAVITAPVAMERVFLLNGGTA